MSDTITLVGTIGTEPDHRRTPDGLAITSFRLVSSNRHFDRATNAWRDGDASWYSVTAFRVLAEHAAASFHKGERVIVIGKLRVRQWETSTAKGTAVEIDADSLGHDLMFGTTRFEKRRGTSAPAAEQVANSQGWGAPRNNDGSSWATPGIVAEEHHVPTPVHMSEHGSGEAQDDARELVPLSGERPF